MKNTLLKDKNEYKIFINKIFILIWFVLLLGILYKILNILVILSISLFLSILISPILNKLNKLKINDFFWVVIIYIFIILFLLLFIFSIIPIFVKQISLLSLLVSTNIDTYIQIYKTQWIQGFNLPIFLQQQLSSVDINWILISIKDNITSIWSVVSKYLSSLAEGSIWILSSITNTIFNIVLVFTFTLFICLERKSIRNLFYSLLPKTSKEYLLKKEGSIVETLFTWIKSQFILWLSIFIITLIGLFSLKLFWVQVEDNLTLALIAWMMEFVPYIWPFIALIPALAIWLWISFKATVLIFILYIIIQQLENNVLVPWVMWKSLSLSPFSVLIWMTIWASLFWILWIIISVPLVAVLQIFLQDYLKSKK